MANQTPLPPTLAKPAKRALAGANIQWLEDLTEITEREFEKLHGIGPNALKQLKLAMDSTGISFKSE